MKVFSKEYWDNWLQKFFALPISFKFLCIFGFFVCRLFNLINGTDLVLGVTGVLVIRGVIQAREVLNSKNLREVKEIIEGVVEKKVKG